jgi:hypothetical protein
VLAPVSPFHLLNHLLRFHAIQYEHYFISLMCSFSKNAVNPPPNVTARSKSTMDNVQNVSTCSLSTAAYLYGRERSSAFTCTTDMSCINKMYLFNAIVGVFAISYLKNGFFASYYCLQCHCNFKLIYSVNHSVYGNINLVVGTKFSLPSPIQ